MALLFFLLPIDALAKIPSDPEYVKQQKLYEAINAPAAWDISVGSPQVVVAVIDVGIDAWHPDLVDNLWVNQREIPGNNIDDDKNGYVDDVNGWNFVEKNNDIRTSVLEDGNDSEAINHGTVAAGLLGARGGNGRDGVGLNWRVQIMPLRALNGVGSGSFEDVATAVNYAVANGADVISMSFVGLEADAYLKQSLRHAYDSDVVVVSAVGNSYTNRDLGQTSYYPACYDTKEENWILGVGSINLSGQLSNFSNYGECLDILAPGEDVYSIERYAPAYGYKDEFGGPWRGTSFSTPLVAGTAALIRSVRPEWSAKEVIQTILKSTDPVSSIYGALAGKLGSGRLNAGRALGLAGQTKPAEEKLRGTFYFNKKNEIYWLDWESGEKKTITKILGGQIKSLTAADVDLDGKDDAVVLLQRDEYFYIRLIKDNGVLIRELALEEEPGFVARQVKARTGDDINRIVVEEYNKKTKQTRFTAFSFLGVFQEETTIKGQASAWGINNAGQVVTVVANKTGGKFFQYNWSNGLIWSKQINWNGELLDFKLGKFNRWSEEQSVLLVAEKKRTVMTLLDWKSGAERKLLTVSGRPLIGLAMGDATGDEFLEVLGFGVKGGEFGMFTGMGDRLKNFTLPSIDGQVK